MNRHASAANALAVRWQNRSRVGSRELKRFRVDALLGKDALGIKLYDQLGIEDYVVCLNCGAKICSLYTHFEVCGGGKDEYRTKWPGAPLRCVKDKKSNAEHMSQRRADDPEGERERGRGHYAKNPVKAKARAKKYRVTHPQRVKKQQRKWLN